MKFITASFALLLLATSISEGQDITITVNADQGQIPISPYIYGKNNNFSEGTAPSAEALSRYKGAGLCFTRENSGNNATKYNWRRKLSSHPDWYNNVYDHNWDAEAQQIFTHFPDMQLMYAFQLLGYAAANKNHNFGDWNYNNSQYWSGVAQNLAGGGTVNPAGGADALVEGNPDLYLEAWNADSTTGILDHWFGTKGINLPQENLQYWNMDNEPEIWVGTHDDVMPTQVSADEFMNRYFAVAKKAREKYPEIKLTGPVTANEWQWYKYAEENLQIEGEYYCWLEYFIKRVADEQKSTGIRLLDVLDIHFYPYETAATDIVQLHRVFYDQNYSYPGANGLKTINGGWENSLNKEYVFKRIENWLTEHFGEGHGIKIGLSEFGARSDDANVNSVLYASMLGTFSQHGLEYFSPWDWEVGMWELLHLFSRYAQDISVQSVSTDDATVSGYASISDQGDSLTLILVNRDLNNTKTVQVEISGFDMQDGNYTTLQLHNLPATETFESHTVNALSESSVSISNHTLTIELPGLSTTAVLLAETGFIASSTGQEFQPDFKLYPNPARERLHVEILQDTRFITKLQIYDQTGRKLTELGKDKILNGNFEIETGNFKRGIYYLHLRSELGTSTAKFIVEH